MGATLGDAAFERRPADWLSADEARERVEGAAERLPKQTVALERTLGRALAENLSARVSLPLYDNSAMDGYALRARDLEGAEPDAAVDLAVVGRVHAGEPEPPHVGPGEAARIMTGAPLPPGADAVVRVEDTDGEATTGRVAIRKAVASGRNVRPAGEDMRLGDVVLQAGQTVTPGVLGVLATLGQAEVPVHEVPTVGVLTTGNELRPVERYDEVLAGTGVPESNGPMLAGMIRLASSVPLDLGIGADDPDELRRRIQSAGEAQVLVTVGGASMGEADHVKRVLDDLGFRQEFWRVRMRPGSPFGFGWLDRGSRRQAVFSLPGNPVSAFVTFELFVRPYLLRLGGHARYRRRTITCTAGERLPASAKLSFFLRVAVDTTTHPPVARLTGGQGSGLVRGLAHAEGLAIVDEDTDAIESGGEVRVMLIDDGPAPVSLPAQ